MLGLTANPLLYMTKCDIVFGGGVETHNLIAEPLFGHMDLFHQHLMFYWVIANEVIIHINHLVPADSQGVLCGVQQAQVLRSKH